MENSKLLRAKQKAGATTMISTWTRGRHTIENSVGSPHDHDKTLLSRQIEATDAAIDKLVYELYGLKPEEIAIVERSGK